MRSPQYCALPSFHMLFSAGLLLAASHVLLRNKETAFETAQHVETEETVVTEYGGGVWCPKNRYPRAILMFKVIRLPLQSAMNVFQDGEPRKWSCHN